MPNLQNYIEGPAVADADVLWNYTSATSSSNPQIKGCKHDYVKIYDKFMVVPLKINTLNINTIS